MKATFDRVLNPDFKSPKCGASLKPMVASVEAVDASTVPVPAQVRAPRPFLPLGGVGVVPHRGQARPGKYGDLNEPEAQIGTGPFKFKKYERGSVIEWEKNQDYFIPGLPYLDGVKQFILVGGPTQLAAAKAATHHAVGRVAADAQDGQAEELQAARGNDVDVYRAPINTIWIVFLNATKPPFNNAGPAPGRAPGAQPPGAGRPRRSTAPACRARCSIRSWSATPRCRSTEVDEDRRAAASPRSRTSPRPRSS